MKQDPKMACHPGFALSARLAKHVRLPPLALPKLSTLAVAVYQITSAHCRS